MVDAVTYKKPRRINVVSVTVVLILGSIAFTIYQFLPLYLKKQEAFRVLEEYGSTYAGKRSYYRADPVRFETLHRKMEAELRNVGLDDPRLETWIEVDGREVRFGCVFSGFAHWPLDVFEPHEFVFEPEHLVVDPR